MNVVKNPTSHCPGTLEECVHEAAKCVPFVWPLKKMIACNPLRDLESQPFAKALETAEDFYTSGSKEHSLNQTMIKWCAAFFDEGEAAICMPGKEEGLYKAWARLAPFDPECVGAKGRASFPETSLEALHSACDSLELPPENWTSVFKTELAALPGWAGYIKWLSEWEGNRKKATLLDYLAIRLSIRAEKQMAPTLRNKEKAPHVALADLEQKERAYKHRLLKQLAPSPQEKAEAQMVFCIDVRSEPFRRHLESLGPLETYGFAGFFGVAVAIANEEGEERESCPALIRPRRKVKESDPKTPGRRLLKAAQNIFVCMKKHFGAPFALVETLGPLCGLFLIKKCFLLRPEKKTIPLCDHSSLPFEDKVQWAETSLRLMGLTTFAPLVIFCGHSSSTTNNPYASALQCGACGGHAGGANAQILASILNEGSVRQALRKRGLKIPETTRFLGAEHDTTTDAVTLVSVPALSSEQKALWRSLEAQLKRAQQAAQEERMAQLPNPRPGDQRSSDWSEVRPEWGLAKNASFIAAPRTLTKNQNLEGRAFLHSYDWLQDKDGTHLEAIMTAPLIVAQWINAQYLFSTLNNRRYGSGNKITQNVVGKIGVMQGNSSDLLGGLPRQSVWSGHDTPYHEPLRLLAVIQAPKERIQSIIDKHPNLESLVDNQWIHITALDPIDRRAFSLEGNGRWKREEAFPSHP